MDGKKLLIPAGVLSAAYLFAIKPNRKREMKDFDGVLYAHRGYHDNRSEAPENSMAAFKKAVERGYGIELDVQLTRDEVPVVIHDFTMHRVMRDAEDRPVSGKVEDYTFEELQQFHILRSEEKIPAFEDVLKLVDGKVPLIVELKIERPEWNPKVCILADELLRNYTGLYCIESFNPMGVNWYRRNRPDVIRGQLSDRFLFRSAGNPVVLAFCQSLLFNGVTKPDFVAYNVKYPNAVSRKLCHGLYKNTAVAWTVKSKEQLEKAKKHFDLYIFDSFDPEA